MREIGLEQFLNRPGRVLRPEVAVDLLPEIGIETETSAGEKVIAFDAVVGIANGNLGGDQAYVADVVLGTGMVAASQVDIQWRIDFNARIAPVADRRSVTLGVGSRELAARIAGTRDQSGANV